ncbi:cytochrome P450 [Streptosporangium sp. NPDC051023]|uniref:cytochrome P450 n=1 Tax=Streptosporangium sp. NPDC051023 TaxID=3155410 RepID=UPI00344F649D
MSQSTMREFPSARPDPFTPPKELAEFREGPPSRIRFPDGNEYWLLSRYADVRAVLADARFSADDTKPGFPQMLVAAEPGQLSFTRMDNPEHNRLRTMVISEFSVRRVATMRKWIQRIVDELLDGMERAREKDQGPVDLVRMFAVPLPTRIICELLGVPYSDHEFLRSRSATVICSTDPEVAVAANVELFEYVERLAVDKKRAPSEDDLLGRLAIRANQGELTHKELVAMGRALLVAGHETTVHSLSLGVLALLSHPDQLRALRADPNMLAPTVEELLRYLTITQGPMARMALEPVEVGGVMIGAGEGVIISLLSANRDPECVAAPDRLDVGRYQGHHFAFGFGAHQCIGAPLAKAEMEIGIDRLFSRFPDLRLACDLKDLNFRDEAPVYGIHELPVTW